MKSKEAFQRIKQACESACLGLGQSPYNRFIQSIIPCREDLEVLRQDLERLEELEKENKILKKVIENSNKGYDVLMKNANIQDLNRLQEIYKLEKALEKSCEKLDYTCPVEEELIDDLNCENCKDNYKECWKKFFLKEDLENE